MRILFFVLSVLISGSIYAQDCKLVLRLLTETGTPIAGQKYSLLLPDKTKVGEWMTDVDGKSTVTLKKGKTYTFEANVGGRIVSTEFPIGDADQLSFDLALPAPIDSVEVMFWVTDDKDVAETEAKISVKLGDQVVFSCVTGIDGRCAVTLKKSTGYKLYIEKFGKTFDDELAIGDDPNLGKFTYHLKIKVVENYVRSFILENVYFDYNKWDLKAEAMPALNDLYNLLESDSRMKIELGGHTDSDGDDAFNMQLSQRRADAVKAWLVNKGVSPNRILTKGYGETVPIDTNATPEGRAKNRRTEVKIIGN